MAENQLSNPFSTGGGGVSFEVQVQASFVALMLSGGYAPCFPGRSIEKIQLQGKVAGYNTDDLIVYVKNHSSDKARKMLGQVKHSIAITKGNKSFSRVIKDAWKDFNNPAFKKQRDIIALITGPLSKTDINHAQWLFEHARFLNEHKEFFRHVRLVRFSSHEKQNKLDVIQYHLNQANGGTAVSQKEVYDFLRHFHMLGYDLDSQSGVVLSLLHSHISQFEPERPNWLFSEIVQFVLNSNLHAGLITRENLPDDLIEAFKRKPVAKIPSEFSPAQKVRQTQWADHQDATYLALITLIGEWQENNQGDIDAVSKLLGIRYHEWQRKAQEILNLPDSPLSFVNGNWKVRNRVDLITSLGSRIFDDHLDSFQSISLSVLQEQDPAFELPNNERFTARIRGKVLSYSDALRNGIAEGLAILGSNPDSCIHCSHGKVESTCVQTIRDLMSHSNWQLWGSLNNLFPILAEAAPNEFLNSIENTLRHHSCLFDDLFSQEEKGNMDFPVSSNYMTGLLWALEGLAWDAEYVVRVCIVLGELAHRDPGGQTSNRPFNSLTTILLPWMPQTLATIEKREVAVKTLLDECPDIGWKLLIRLLPNQHQTSMESYKPRWRKVIPDDWSRKVTRGEYWQQISAYAELSVNAAGQDVDRISTLIEHCDNIPQSAFEQFLKILSSQEISELNEEQRLSIWESLSDLTRKHRKFSDAEWALPINNITCLEQIAEQLAPKNPINSYRYLFTGHDFDLHDEIGNFEEQQKKLQEKRDIAVSAIFSQGGIENVTRFADLVPYPGQVGHALGAYPEEGVDQHVFPFLLDSENDIHKALVTCYIMRCHSLKGWEWFDRVDTSNWMPKQIGEFLACAPFGNETWQRASEWLRDNDYEYWSRTGTSFFGAPENLSIAIGQLIKHGRPYAAINCLDHQRHIEQIDTNQCFRALLAAVSSTEPKNVIDSYHISELIKFLQNAPSVSSNDLFEVEWAYLSLLDGYNGVKPITLESKLANDPEFFSEIISVIYRSDKDERAEQPSSEAQALAMHAWKLLDGWKTPPGTQSDGTFDEESFTKWLARVKQLCAETGRLRVALYKTGKVLIHTPADSSGLWINCAVAKFLNENSSEADTMREGFGRELCNSRGAYWGDPTGKPERQLAEKFHKKAEDVESAGFHRLAATLRELRDAYNREADMIISRHSSEGEEG